MIRIDDDYIEYVKDYWFPGSSLLPLKINNPYFQSMEIFINKKDLCNIEDIIYNTLGNWKDHIIYEIVDFPISYYDNFPNANQKIIRKKNLDERGMFVCTLYYAPHIRDKQHFFDTALKLLKLKAFV